MRMIPRMFNIFVVLIRRIYIIISYGYRFTMLLSTTFVDINLRHNVMETVADDVGTDYSAVVDHVRYNVWGNVLSCIFYKNCNIKERISTESLSICDDIWMIQINIDRNYVIRCWILSSAMMIIFQWLTDSMYEYIIITNHKVIIYYRTDYGMKLVVRPYKDDIFISWRLRWWGVWLWSGWWYW